MLRHDEQIHDRKRFEIVVHEEQVRIVARSQTFAFRLEGTIDNPRPELAFLTFQFELFAARGTEEICERAVVWERRNLGIAAVWAICPSAYPGFRPSAGALRTAGVTRLGFFEAEFHVPRELSDVQRK